MRTLAFLAKTVATAIVVFAWTTHATAFQTEDDDTEKASGKVVLTLDPGGHTSFIYKALFTPDGKQVITASRDDSIRIWDVTTGEMTKVLRLPGKSSRAIALSPDGEMLAVGRSYRGGETKGPGTKVEPVIYLVAIKDAGIRAILRGHTGELDALAFSTDGKLLASGGDDKSIRTWKLPDGKPGPRFTTKDAIMALAFSPDGTQLVVGRSKGCDIRDSATGKVIPLKGGNFALDGCASVNWSKDGKTVATCADDGVRLWEPDGRLRSLLVHRRPKSLDFTPDSRQLLVTSNPTTRLYDASTGKVSRSLTGVETFTARSTLSPDGQLAATVNVGTDGVETIIWKTSSGTVLKRLMVRNGLGGGDLLAKWSGDGKLVSWHPGSGRTSFDLVTLQFGPPQSGWKEVRGPVLKEGAISLKELSRTRAQVIEDDRVISELKAPPSFRWSYAVGKLTLIGRDRAALLVARKGDVFLLFETATGKLVFTSPPGIRSFAPSPDGRHLLTIRNQNLQIYDGKHGAELLTFTVVGNDWIAWTPEGYYAATPGGERMIGWLVDQGIDKLPTYYPLERFRKKLYRPDVITLLLEKGNVKDALETANAALRKEGKTVAAGVADVEKLLPPRVTLTVSDKNSLPKVSLAVSAAASTPSQPIRSLRVLVDGRPLPNQEGTIEFKEAKTEYKGDLTITLPGEKANGPYRLAVLVRGDDSSGISEPVEVAYVNKAKLPALHVLSVGINNYQDSSLNLQFAAPDARALADAFGKSANKGGMFTQVSSKLLIDRDAGRDRILQALAELRKTVKANDLVVVSFACHGVKDKDGFYLLTVEADTSQLSKTALPGDVLRKTLADIPCQVLLLLDACHSAGFGDGRKLSKLGLRPATDDATRALTDDEVGVAVMCAAMGHEKAEEKDGNGLFTKAIVQALGQVQGVPFNRRDHRLYIHHLHTFVFDEVKDRSNDRQHPFLSLPWIVESFPVVQFSASSAPR